MSLLRSHSHLLLHDSSVSDRTHTPQRRGPTRVGQQHDECKVRPQESERSWKDEAGSTSRTGCLYSSVYRQKGTVTEASRGTANDQVCEQTKSDPLRPGKPTGILLPFVHTIIASEQSWSQELRFEHCLLSKTTLRSRRQQGAATSWKPHEEKWQRRHCDR